MATLEEAINYFKKDTILFSPGERHDYSNINFTLLGRIIEKVSGKSFPDYIEEYIFKPLEMTNSSIPVEGQVIPNLATGYEFKDDKIVYARYHSLNQTWGTSGIHTTVDDLAKWFEGLMNSKVVSRETLIKAWTPFTLNSGEQSIYGFGFYPDIKFNRTSIVHNGFIFGYSTSDMYFPEDDLLILVASNISEIKKINTNTIAYDIAASIYKDEVLVLNEDVLDTYVGTYNMVEGFKTKVFRKDSTLYVEVAGNTANELIATSETKFKVKDFPAEVEFEVLKENGIKIFLSRGTSKFQGIKE
jgi:CubicO group peptidase (beta-lactamase class C family)